MPATIPSSEPDTIVAGDTVEWTKSIADFPATDGWTLKYSLQLVASLDDPITFSATPDGADYSVSVANTITTEWDAGNYVWTSLVDNGTERHRVGTGTLTILGDPEEAPEGTHATRTLYLIELAIEGRIPKQLEMTTIDGNNIMRIPIQMLMDLRLKYQAEVRAEQTVARAAAGLGSRRQMLTRFRSPFARFPWQPNNP